MKKNYLLFSFTFTLIVILILFVGYFFTPVTIAGFTIKKWDILSDIRPEKEISAVSGNEQKTLPEATEEPCPQNITCIEEFTSDDSAMKHFYEILDSISRLDRPVRIGFFGDSFIEGDILTCDIREQLQKMYGGCGVGYVPITSATAGFRRTVVHGFQNFETVSLLNSNFDLGIAGFRFKAKEGAYVFYRGVDKPRLNYFQTVRLLYQGGKYIFSSYSINNQKGIVPLSPDTSPGIHCINIRNDSIRSIAFSFSPGMVVYGVYLDCDKGIAVDNFSMRGHSGLNLRNISESNLRQTDDLLPYDLIVLQYGLNTAGTNTVNYEGYKKEMSANVAHIKKSFPEASIILMGVGDRSTRKEGEYVTMPGILNLIPVQQKIAEGSQIAFWNTCNAMGGENSMPRFVAAQPPLAAKDYTHLSFDGGKVIATQFVNALIYGKKQYDKKKAHSTRNVPENK
ncbi:MAG: hypothetical protein FWF54_09065 [Candidatus Azobacteroides sp.]|nr:hypothetical protein [Candidatus Azobacteroides sp.]